jgi:hypothetical protein
VQLFSGNAAMYGAQSAGVSATTPQLAFAIRGGTIRAYGTGVLPVRGIIVNGPNRFEVRENVITANGSGPNSVGVETTDASAILGVKLCSVNGDLFDVLQTAGQIRLGATDMQNHTAPLGMHVDISPTRTFFGILGNPAGNTIYYLPPSIVPVVSASTTTPYTFKFVDTQCIFAIAISFSGTFAAGEAAILTIYKNGVATGLSITLNNLSPPDVLKDNVGVTFTPADVFDMRLAIVGSPDVQAFNGRMLSY